MGATVRLAVLLTDRLSGSGPKNGLSAIRRHLDRFGNCREGRERRCSWMPDVHALRSLRHALGLGI